MYIHCSEEWLSTEQVQPQAYLLMEGTRVVKGLALQSERQDSLNLESALRLRFKCDRKSRTFNKRVVKLFLRSEWSKLSSVFRVGCGLAGTGAKQLHSSALSKWEWLSRIGPGMRRSLRRKPVSHECKCLFLSSLKVCDSRRKPLGHIAGSGIVIILSIFWGMWMKESIRIKMKRPLLPLWDWCLLVVTSCTSFCVDCQQYFILN